MFNTMAIKYIQGQNKVIDCINKQDSFFLAVSLQNVQVYIDIHSAKWADLTGFMTRVAYKNRTSVHKLVKCTLYYNRGHLGLPICM